MNEEDLTDSYSQEANENMKVAIENLVTNLTQVGSADAYKNALFGLKIMVDKRPRRITAVANVEPGLKPRSLDLMVYSRELIPLVVEEIKLAGFKNVTSDIELQRVTIIVPAPTLEDLERIEDDLDRVARSTVSNLTKVKANSSQRLKAGLENEYIEVAEATKARKNSLRRQHQQLSVQAGFLKKLSSLAPWDRLPQKTGRWAASLSIRQPRRK